MAKSKTPRKKAKQPIKRKRRQVKPPQQDIKKPVFNCHHPDVGFKCEEAFIAGGVQYYRFKQEYQMPTGRYKWVMNYLREVDLRMSLETMRGYMDIIKKTLNGGKKGVIDLFEVSKVVHSIETRLNLAFEPETVKRLASVTYFDDTEDLRGYDLEHNKKKRQLWDEAGSLDFFLTNPIAELLGLNNFSPDGLQEYMRQAMEALKESPIYDPLTYQPASTFENGTNQSS